ncbi:hypothetical protein [Streptomyces clavifer]|uniref:hypothetical protein n=1 Tax=Streptomyces clavifer TaxID=68188 RepID=UPI0033BEC082
MRMCKKCGARKRRWPRSCSRCHSASDRAETVADVAEVAVEIGVLGWIARGGVAVVRLVLRALN